MKMPPGGDTNAYRITTMYDVTRLVSYFLFVYFKLAVTCLTQTDNDQQVEYWTIVKSKAKTLHCRTSYVSYKIGKKKTS